MMRNHPRIPSGHRRCRFTLIEILAAMAVFSVLGLLLYQILHGSEKLMVRTGHGLDVTRNARIVFRVIQQDLAGIKAGYTDGERILVDAAGIGARKVAFTSSTVTGSGADSPVHEVGYGISGNHLIRYITGNNDVGKWNFIDTDPSVWAADSSWGTARAVVGGVQNFDIAFFWADPNPPYRVAYDAASDSDLVPDFADVAITLVHPSTLDNSIQSQDQSRRTFRTRIGIGKD